MAQPDGGTVLQRQIALSGALNDKLNALGQANICISGQTAQEVTQRQANSSEIADIHLALQRVLQGIFNWPGQATVAALIQMSASLNAASLACTNKAAVISQSDALIPIVRAASV
jgi:hypothetical protein